MKSAMKMTTPGKLKDWNPDDDSTVLIGARFRGTTASRLHQLHQLRRMRAAQLRRLQAARKAKSK